MDQENIVSTLTENSVKFNLVSDECKLRADNSRRQHLVTSRHSRHQTATENHNDIKSATTFTRESRNRQRKLAIVSWTTRFGHRRRSKSS